MFAFDTETALIRPGCNAPELVCVTYASPGEEPRLLRWDDARALAEAMLEGDEVLVGHNVAYDFAVFAAQWPDLIPAIFAKYERHQVSDTMIRAMLLDTASGKRRGFNRDGVWYKPTYDLGTLAKRYCDIRLSKPSDEDAEDHWRLRYAELRDVPVEAWPVEATSYALEDARATMEVWLAQEPHAEFLEDERRQCKYDFVLKLISTWGLRTSKEAVDRYAEETQKEYDAVLARLIAAGLARKDGSRDTKAAKARMAQVCTEKGLPIRKTKGDGKPNKKTGIPANGICLDADACEATDDEILGDYADFSKLKKVQGTDIPLLYGGVEYPIHTRYGLAETGRTTSRKPNVQNFRRGE